MVITEQFYIGNRLFNRTYSDAGRYLVGGMPYGQYIEATEPADFGRTYIEGDLIPPEEGDSVNNTEQLLNIILGEEI